MYLNKSNFFWKNEPIFCFTIDLDWASESAIKYTFNYFEKFNIPITFFVTHYSKFLFDKINYNEIDAGIHPNFLPNSSHGNNYKEVINYCTKLLPKAKSFRCHRYFDVNDINEKLYDLGFLYDSNLCTFLQRVDPFVHRSGLIRFPIYFEDGAYLYHNKNLKFNEISEELFYSKGLIIINIHPMHMALNSPDFLYARKIKDNLTRQKWNSLNDKDLKNIKNYGLGIKDFIVNLLKFINKNNLKTYTLKNIYEMIKRD
ncbi:MAG: hypothetical protein FH751_15750 [Firmicutes bacterium]|nr:hypothetical protein [Bacillota bacterium]